ncbi:MAG: hypothetical protein KAW12_15130 [Candidatus Aminicenantes bacterium]|nr:hypothetical protein [Candidatus Aminicenantes bacterium]
MVKYEKKDFYEIKADPEKNRLYLSILGHWTSPEEVPDYVEHFKKAVDILKPGLTSYTLIEDAKPPKLSVQGLHKANQKYVNAKGITKTGVVLAGKGIGKILQKVTLAVVGKLSGLDQKIFETEEEAIVWLDE